MGLCKVYTMNTKSPKEAKKRAYGVELMRKFKKWAAVYGDEKTKKFQHPFGCAQKMFYFVLEGEFWESEFEPEQPLELLQSTSSKKEAGSFNWKGDIRKKMKEMGLYKVYHTNPKSIEESQKMAYGVKLNEDFKKWASVCGDPNTKKSTNQFGSTQKIVFFLLEGTKYK